jgi:threonine dehydrogenase-like Zn-dependent dehydrogenase
MRAISLSDVKSIEIVDIPEPQMGPEDVLIAVHYVGLCGSDLNAYRGGFPLLTYPRILGHEVSGIIADKGRDVPETLDINDRVMVSPYTNCGVCPACRAGRPNCCQFNQTLGLQRDGVLTGRFAIHHSKVHTSPTLALEELVLVEPLSVGYHATNRGRVTEIDTVLVIGCGTIGVGAVAAAARKGATVLVADVDEGKLQTARKFGAHTTIDAAREDVLAAVKDLTGGEGVDVAIEAVGLPATFRQAVEAVSYAGRVVYIGYAEQEVCYDTVHFVRKELDIMGARNALRVFRAVIKMMERHEFPFTDLITGIYRFEETAAALRDWDVASGQITKLLIQVAS